MCAGVLLVVWEVQEVLSDVSVVLGCYSACVVEGRVGMVLGWARIGVRGVPCRAGAELLYVCVFDFHTVYAPYKTGSKSAFEV